jgi:polysaccharide export outer membrane protein
MKTHRALFLLVAAGLLAGVSARVSAADAPKAADAKSAKPASAASSDSDAAAAFQVGNYKIKPTEVITISTVEDSNASGDFRIGIDGNVQLPYLHDHPVKVAGLSTSEAADLIAKTYVQAGIFVNPSITVSIKEFLAQQVNFIGEVNKPGPIPIPVGKKLTLVQAFTQAGGPTHNAAGTVTITRINANGTTNILKDVDLLGATKDPTKDIDLQEGDTITLGQSLLGDVWH